MNTLGSQRPTSSINKQLDSFGYDKNSFTYNSDDYKVKKFIKEASKTEANAAYATIDTGSSTDNELAKAFDTYNSNSVDDDGNPLTNADIVKVLQNRVKKNIPSSYKKISSRIDISHSSFDRSLKSLYFADSNKKIAAFKNSEIYLKIFKTPEYQLNIRVSKEYKLVELKLKITKPSSSQFEKLYLESTNFLQVDLIIDIDSLLVDTFVRSTSGEFEVGNYLFEYPKLHLKQINEGNYSYTDSKSATYLTLGLAKSLDPDFENYI